MKSNTDLRSNLGSNLNHSNGNLSNGNTNASNNNLNPNFLNNASQRKSAVHDLSQVLIEDCQKLMIECHKSISKYHNSLLGLSNAGLNEIVNKEELRTLRIQNYTAIKINLEKLLPQFDQVNFNDNELYNHIQQIIAYLEYLKVEFIRHFYILKSFSMQTTQIILKQNDDLATNDGTKKTELAELQNDINEIDLILHKLVQKYYIFVPDLINAVSKKWKIKDGTAEPERLRKRGTEPKKVYDHSNTALTIECAHKISTKFDPEIQVWADKIENPKGDFKASNKKSGKNYSKMGSFNLFSKCKFICCICSPKYI